MPLNIPLILVIISLCSFFVSKVHSNISWVSIYYNGVTNILFITYFVFLNIISNNFLNIFFIVLFFIIFIVQAALPIRARIITENEMDNVNDIQNLDGVFNMINTSQISDQIDIAFMFEVLMLGTYQAKYMLKVFSYLISKDIIYVNEKYVIINKHINFFTKVILHIGFVPPHKKVKINLLK